MKHPNKFPPGWDDNRVRALLDYYETQTAAEAIAEDEAALADAKWTVMEVPTDLVPAVRRLIARRKRSA